MKELRDFLLVGAAVALMMVQVHPMTAKMAKPDSVVDGTVMDETVVDGVVMDTTSITKMEADLRSGPMCCRSRSCSGCPCRKPNLKYYREFEEMLRRREEEEEDVGDLGDDLPGEITTDEDNQSFTLSVTDCIICRLSHC